VLSSYLLQIIFYFNGKSAAHGPPVMTLMYAGDIQGLNEFEEQFLHIKGMFSMPY